MEKLESILRNQTKTLKEQYLKKSIEWGHNQFDRYLSDERIHRWENSNSPTGFSFSKKFFGNTRSENIKMDKICNILFRGREKFIEDIERESKNHYEKSVIKLCKRILEKDLNLDNIKLETSHIGINIETTITDGVKTIRAYTVLAYGPIQRPHYRYLVK